MTHGEPVKSGQPALVWVVEIPKGTRNKYEYDPELGGIQVRPPADERRDVPGRPPRGWYGYGLSRPSIWV